MKKVIINKELSEILLERKSFLNRSDIQLFTARTNQDIFNIHRTEAADIIITDLDAPGMTAEALCKTVREMKKLQRVSIVIIHDSSAKSAERLEKCNANFFLPKPLDLTRFLFTVNQLMHIADRMAYRSLVSIQVEGKTSQDKPFIGQTVNISASGMLLLTDRDLLIGDTIKCSFYLSEAAQVTARAMVVRKAEKKYDIAANEYGVRFQNLSKSYVAMIEAFIKSHMD